MTQGVLSHLNVFRTDQNIKHSLASFVGAILESDNVASLAVIVAASGTYTYTPASPNQVLVVKCSAPIEAQVTIPAAGGGDPAGGSFTKVVSSLLYLDVGVSSVVFTNTSDSSINLTLISG